MSIVKVELSDYEQSCRVFFIFVQANETLDLQKRSVEKTIALY